MKKEIVIINAAILALVGVAAVVGGGDFFSCGGASIAESSKTSECGRDLQRALEAFRHDMDMPFAIGPEDYRAVFQTGAIEKGYYRDGIKITASFHLKKTDTGCFLKFYKRARSEPGTYKSTSGDYGSVAVSSCECQE